MRILGIDYGRKQVGIAVTDPEQIIVTGLSSVKTNELTKFLRAYLSNEQVVKIVIGYPTHKDGQPTMLVRDIEHFGNWLQKHYPSIELDYQDEHLSTEMALEKLQAAKGKKSKYLTSGLVDQMSAVIILQSYLGHI